MHFEDQFFTSSNCIAVPLKFLAATSNYRERNFRSIKAEHSNGNGKSGEAVISPSLGEFMPRLNQWAEIITGWQAGADILQESF